MEASPSYRISLVYVKNGQERRKDADAASFEAVLEKLGGMRDLRPFRIVVYQRIRN